MPKILLWLLHPIIFTSHFSAQPTVYLQLQVVTTKLFLTASLISSASMSCLLFSSFFSSFFFFLLRLSPTSFSFLSLSCGESVWGLASDWSSGGCQPYNTSNGKGPAESSVTSQWTKHGTKSPELHSPAYISPLGLIHHILSNSSIQWWPWDIQTAGGGKPGSSPLHQNFCSLLRNI